jgi:NMD protein affecting ribosome stability and mRNA decay
MKYPLKEYPDFGTCVICGKEYTVYGQDNLCDDCMIEGED